MIIVFLFLTAFYCFRMNRLKKELAAAEARIAELEKTGPVKVSSPASNGAAVTNPSSV